MTLSFIETQASLSELLMILGVVSTAVYVKTSSEAVMYTWDGTCDGDYYHKYVIESLAILDLLI